MVKEQLLVIKKKWAFALRGVKRLEKVIETVCQFEIIYRFFFSKKQWQLCFGLGFRFRPFRYKFLLVNNSNFQSWIIINSKYRPKRGMNRFAALNCVSRAELVSPAVNRLLPRFEQKMVKIPKNKLNKSFSIFGFLRGMNRFVPHWFIS